MQAAAKKPRAPAQEVSPRFQHFAAIDWSGAAGERHKGMALAICGAGRRAGAGSARAIAGRARKCCDWLLDEMPA